MSDNTGSTCQYDCYPPHTNPYFQNFSENDEVMGWTQSMAIIFENFHFLVTVFISYVKKGGKTGQKRMRFETKKDTCMRSDKNDSKLHVWTEKFSYEKRKICVLNSKQRSVDWPPKANIVVQVLFVGERVGSRCLRGSRQRLNLCTELKKFLN